MIYAVEIKGQDGSVVFSGTVNTSPEDMEKIRASLPEAFQVVPRKLEFLRFRTGRLQSKRPPRVVSVAWKKPRCLRRLAGIMRKTRFGKSKTETRQREVLSVE